MLEMLIKPKRIKKRPWEMFFVGLVYSVLAIFVTFVISRGNSVFTEAGGFLVVTMTVLFSWPFMYHIIKSEEGKDLEIDDQGKLMKEHSMAIVSLMWLFLGIVVGYSLCFLIFDSQKAIYFGAQIKTFCIINPHPTYESCLAEGGFSSLTGMASGTSHFMNIFTNNVSVLIFTILFSLVFGAGAIFVLAWNASVIAAAVGRFAEGGLANLPISLLRYLIHGIPEIAAYFVGALAGGIVSVAVIRRDLERERKWVILQDAISLVIVAIIILLIAGIMEVYLTPVLVSMIGGL